MARKRHGMYLSPTDDAQLVQELGRCTVRGRKSDLLRNYALLGYQRALELCASSNLTEDHSALTRALAELFAPDDTPPDFRSAAEFIKARMAGLGEARPTAAPMAAPVANSAAKPTQAQEALPATVANSAANPTQAQEALPATGETVVESKPRQKQWSGLQSLVGGSSKDQGGS